MHRARRYKQRVTLAEGHAKGITAVAFSPQGSYIATAGLDGCVCIWNVEEGKLLYRFSGVSPVLSLAWVPSGEESLLFGTKDGNIAMLTISLALNDFSMGGFWAHKYPVEHLSIMGDYLASGAQRELKVWQWLPLEQRFSCVHVFPPPPKTSHNEHAEVLVTSLHWTGVAPRPLLMVTYMHHAVQLYDATTLQSIRTISLQGKMASLSPDGSLLAVSNVVRGFDVYRTDTEQPIGMIPASVGTQQPTPVLFIHNGNAIVCGSTVGVLEIWDMKLGKLHSLVVPNQARVLALAAHSQPALDGGPYRFMIATGIFHENTPSSCIVWEAAQSDNANVDAEAGVNAPNASPAGAEASTDSEREDTDSSAARAFSDTGVLSMLRTGLKVLWVSLFIVAVAFAMTQIPIAEGAAVGENTT